MGGMGGRAAWAEKWDRWECEPHGQKMRRLGGLGGLRRLGGLGRVDVYTLVIIRLLFAYPSLFLYCSYIVRKG